MQILLVDDEIELTDPLSRVLTREGYGVDVAYDGAAGSQMAVQGSYNLLILDWMLPFKTGLEICQQLRRTGQTTPVLFLTAKDTVNDRVQGLDAGADDYLVKPFELRELLARVRALLRRSAAVAIAAASVGEIPYPMGSGNELSVHASPLLRVADLELDCENQLAYRQGRMIELSEKESQLLEYFMRHAGQLLTHMQIHQHLWKNGDQPSSNVLAALIRLLRRKIEATGENPLVHTVYGKGYRFGAASVETI